VYPRERAEGQTFIVDAALFVDTRAAARGDDLQATADYGSIAGKIVALIEGDPVNLIETLADRIASACLADPAVRVAEITVHKPDAPIPVPFDDVTVTIRREADPL
jgi:dihydroneopterin aldolase